MNEYIATIEYKNGSTTKISITHSELKPDVNGHYAVFRGVNKNLYYVNLTEVKEISIEK